MVGHGGSSAGSYLADPTSPIPSHSASIVATRTLRVNITEQMSQDFEGDRDVYQDIFCLFKYDLGQKYYVPQV